MGAEVLAIEVAFVEVLQRVSPSDSVLLVTPSATTEPFSSNELRAPRSPAWIVSLPLSAEKMPVESTVKAKTDATTTNAIRMMAVSSPVTPSCPLNAPRDFLRCLNVRSCVG